MEVIVAKQFTVGGSSCDCNQHKNWQRFEDTVTSYHCILSHYICLGIL